MANTTIQGVICNSCENASPHHTPPVIATASSFDIAQSNPLRLSVASGTASQYPARLTRPPPSPLTGSLRPFRSPRRGVRAPWPPMPAGTPRPRRPDFGARLAALNSSVPTLPRVPRGARICVAHMLKILLEEVATNNSDAAWEDLLLFHSSPTACSPSRRSRTGR